MESNDSSVFKYILHNKINSIIEMKIRNIETLLLNSFTGAAWLDVTFKQVVGRCMINVRETMTRHVDGYNN